MKQNTKLVASLILSLMLTQFCGNLVLNRSILAHEYEKPRNLAFLARAIVQIVQAFKKFVIGFVEIFIGIVGIIVGIVIAGKYLLDSGSTNEIFKGSCALLCKGVKNVVGAPVRLVYRTEEQKQKDQAIYSDLGISKRRRNLSKSNFIKAGIVTALSSMVKQLQMTQTKLHQCQQVRSKISTRMSSKPYKKTIKK